MNYRQILFSILLIATGSCLSANSIDSLFQIFENTDGKRHIDVANELIKELYHAGYVMGISEIPYSEPQSRVDGYIYCSMGGRALFSGDNYGGIKYYERSIERYGLTKDEQLMTDGLLRLHFCYKHIGNYSKAFDCLQECLKIYTDNGNELWRARTLYSIGQLYSENDKDSLAIEYLDKALTIQRKLNVSDTESTLATLSDAHLKIGNIEQAESNALEALAVNIKGEGALQGREFVLHTLAQVYKAKQEYDKSMDYLGQSLELIEKGNGRVSDKAYTYFLMGETLRASGKNRDKAEACYLQAVSLGEEAGSDYNRQLAYAGLANLYRDHNPQKAFEYQDRYIAVRETLFDEQTQQQLNEFQVKYDTQEKELEIIRQQATIGRQRSLQYIFIAGLVVATLLLLLLVYIIQLNRKRNKELREMNATKDKFFSIISHDLKNPAIAQRNALQMLVEHGEEWDRDLLQRYYDELLKSSEGQVVLLYDLLNWAQVQTGRMPYNPAKIDLTDVIGLEANLMQNMVTSKDIELSLQMPDTAIVSGDRNMLATIIRNLLANAIKFTERGGKITIAVTPESNHYNISISDTGIGMSKEQINNLFHIARPHSKPGTAGEQGSGLGLIVVKELIRKHDSEIKVKSEPGKGSRFEFLLNAEE